MLVAANASRSAPEVNKEWKVHESEAPKEMPNKIKSRNP
jgi:hypothetical protein